MDNTPSTQAAGCRMDGAQDAIRKSWFIRKRLPIMPENQANPNPEVAKGDGSVKSQPPYVAIAVAALGVISSLGTAYLTAQGTAKQTAKATAQDELTGFKLDQISGAIVGEIRAFAFGAGRKDPDIKKLRALGWLECAGQAISHDDYPRLYDALAGNHPWGLKSGGLLRVPDLRGMFIRGWFHGAELLGSLGDEVHARVASDPDRTGSAGNNVGSLQEDQLESHTHGPPGAGTVSYPEMHVAQRNAERWETNQPGKLGWSVRWRPGALPEGKKETSPRNVLVMYCIYTGTTVKDHTEDGSTRNK